MKKILLISLSIATLFSCSQKQEPTKLQTDLNSSQLRSAQSETLLDCEDKGTPYAASFICGKKYIVGIYNPDLPIELSKPLEIFNDSTSMNILLSKIVLDSANYFPSANTSTDYVLTFNPTTKTVGRSLFPTATTYTAGQGITISSGVISKTKRQETYTGTTASTVGTYTVTFGTAYGVAPNIVPSIQGDFASYNVVISSKSTTGFTAKVYTLSSILSLGLVPQYTPVGGVVVDVIVTEK